MGKLGAALVAAFVVAPTPASAEVEPPPDSEPMLGVGYKIGNGIGFVGADLLIAPVPRFSLDLHGAWFDGGVAAAPALQFHLWRDSTPYAAVGLQYVRVSIDDTVVRALGFFANIGYEWRWSSGLGIQLGGGIQYLEEVRVQDGDQISIVNGDPFPNIEFGIRYRFL